MLSHFIEPFFKELNTRGAVQTPQSALYEMRLFEKKLYEMSGYPVEHLNKLKKSKRLLLPHVTKQVSSKEDAAC